MKFCAFPKTPKVRDYVIYVMTLISINIHVEAQNAVTPFTARWRDVLLLSIFRGCG